MEQLFEGVNDKKYYYSVYLMYPRYASWLKLKRKALPFFACTVIPFAISGLALLLIDNKAKMVFFWIFVSLGAICVALLMVFLALIIYVFFNRKPMPCKKGHRYVLYGDLDNEAIVSESDEGRKSVKVFNISYSQFYIAISETEEKVLLVPNDDSVMRYLKEHYSSRFLVMS